MSKIAVALIFILGCLSTLVATVWGVDYQISYLNEDIASVCDEYPDNFVTKVADLSKLNFELMEDDDVHVTGSATILRDIPDLPITLSGQVFKKERGQWINTIYNIQRDDLCFSLFNPAEIWYRVTKSVPEEYRVCPPKKNFTIDLDCFAGAVVSIPDRNAEGEYKIEIKIGYGVDPNDLVCANVFIYADKK